MVETPTGCQRGQRSGPDDGYVFRCHFAYDTYGSFSGDVADGETMKFNSREEVVDWLTEQAKERVVDDALELMRRDGLTKEHLKQLLPTMLAEAFAWRDDILSNLDSLAMDLNGNVPEHPTVN